MFALLRLKAARAARKAGLLTGGLLCLVVGVAFVTASIFLAIAASHGAILAALVVGGFYLGVGLILIGLAGRSRHVPAQKAAAPPPAADSTAMVNAFLSGVYAGVSAKRST